MAISIKDETAEAALRAASKAGYLELVRDLLDAGVRAGSQNGIAADVARFYGHGEVEGVLRAAIARETDAGHAVP